MPCQGKNNFELFMEYIGKISALIEESHTSNIAIVGDFTAAIDTQFDVELQELCNNLSIVISDCNYYGRNSGMCTHVHSGTSVSLRNIIQLIIWSTILDDQYGISVNKTNQKNTLYPLKIMIVLI